MLPFGCRVAQHPEIQAHQRERPHEVPSVMQQRVKIVGLGEIHGRHCLEPKDKLAAFLSEARKAVFTIHHILLEFFRKPLGLEISDHRPLPPHLHDPRNKSDPICLPHTRVFSGAGPHCIKDALDAHPAIRASVEQIPDLMALKADLFVDSRIDL